MEQTFEDKFKEYVSRTGESGAPDGEQKENLIIPSYEAERRESLTLRRRRSAGSMVSHRRRSSFLFSDPNSIFGSFESRGGPPDLNRIEATTNVEKAANLSLELYRIYDVGGVHGLHSERYNFEKMAKTYVNALKAYLNPDEAMHDWTFAWHLEEESDIPRILDELKKPVSEIMKQAVIGKATRCLASLTITIFDNITDYLLAAEYFQRGYTRMGALTILWPLLSNLLQTLLTIADADTKGVIFASTIGLKPFVDTWRAVTSASKGNRKFHPVLAMSLNRSIELIAESIPQTCLKRSGLC